MGMGRLSKRRPFPRSRASPTVGAKHGSASWPTYCVCCLDIGERRSSSPPIGFIAGAVASPSTPTPCRSRSWTRSRRHGRRRFRACRHAPRGPRPSSPFHAVGPMPDRRRAPASGIAPPAKDAPASFSRRRDRPPGRSGSRRRCGSKAARRLRSRSRGGAAVPSIVWGRGNGAPRVVAPKLRLARPRPAAAIAGDRQGAS
jgi:hypothetical protein